MSDRRRWIVSASTTMQELDRALRERAPADGSPIGLTIYVAVGVAGERIFEVIVDEIAHRSRYLSAAIDGALARHDDSENAKGRAA